MDLAAIDVPTRYQRRRHRQHRDVADVTQRPTRACCPAPHVTRKEVRHRRVSAAERHFRLRVAAGDDAPEVVGVSLDEVDRFAVGVGALRRLSGQVALHREQPHCVHRHCKSENESVRAWHCVHRHCKSEDESATVWHCVHRHYESEGESVRAWHCIHRHCKSESESVRAWHCVHRHCKSEDKSDGESVRE